MWRKIAQVVLGIVLLVIAVIALIALVTTPADKRPFEAKQSGFLVMAHRGGRGLWPENTLYAFEQAVDMGVDVLEMDIHSTADGVLVTMHDETVDRTTDGHGPIHDFTLADLKSLDAGYNWSDDDGQSFPFRGQGINVATLEELFITFPDILMNIEIKQADPPIIEDFCQMIKDYGREETILVGSFDAGTVEAFRVACPGISTSVTEPEARTFFILNKAMLGAVYRPAAEAFQVPEYSGNLHVVTEGFVSSAHSHNMDVHVWTVNEKVEMERLISLGVDGIISDYPDRLIEVLGR